MKLRAAADDLFSTKAFATRVMAPDGAPPQVTPSYCTQCGTGLMLLERAARLCRCSPDVLYRWIEDGQLHFYELANGSVMVCGRTLAERMNEAETETARLPGVVAPQHTFLAKRIH